MIKQVSSPAQPHQIARSLCALFRMPNPSTDLTAVLAFAQQSPLSLAPFDLTHLTLVPEQLSVVPQVMFPKPRSSRLFAHLIERPDEPHLVVDSFRTGKESIYYCLLTSDVRAPSHWLSRMGVRPNLLVNHAEGDLVLAAPAFAFIA